MNAFWSYTRRLSIVLILTELPALGFAQASTGFTRTITCSTCQTQADFGNAALADNYENLQGSNVNYVVVSSSSSLSAFVEVAGYWTTITGYNIQYSYWTPYVVGVVDPSGTPLSSDPGTAQAQMGSIDVGLFGFGRSNSPKVSTVAMPANYASSFIDSEEGETSPGISNGLLLAGVSENQMSPGTTLLVTFSDGSKAVFVKQSSAATYLWKWDGQHAWDKNGNPINRDGSLKTNSSTSGSQVSSSIPPLVYASDVLLIYTTQRCTTSSNLNINGVDMGTWSGFVPCDE